jgi:hypothetical protein
MELKHKSFYLTAGQDCDGVASASARLQGVKNEFLCENQNAYQLCKV